MLIVLTSEQEIKNEATFINQLFNNGLETLHLRKPNFNRNHYLELLNQINPKYYSQIMIHQYLDLCLKFKLKGIHIQEQARLNLAEGLESYVNKYQSKNYTVSSSFHEAQVLEKCHINFDYHLLSPVFSSISKQGYKGRKFDVNHIHKNIIGIGGISAEVIKETIQLGYQGIGVLGAVWNTENPIESFKKIYLKYYQELKNNHPID